MNALCNKSAVSEMNIDPIAEEKVFDDLKAGRPYKYKKYCVKRYIAKSTKYLKECHSM
jgi:hypothetical protein